MGNGRGRNATALRTGGGRRLAGQRTVSGMGRLRRARGSLGEALNAARANNARRARRRARPSPSAR